MRTLLLNAGALEDHSPLGQGVVWRVRLGSAVFIGYSTGVVYCPGGTEPELPFIFGRIAALTSSR